MIQLDLLKKVITKNKILDDKNLNAILEQIKNEKISLEQYLMDKHLATEEILYQATA